MHAVAPTNSANAKGQRITFQTSLVVGSSNTDASPCPGDIATNATTARRPALMVSTNARPYFRRVGRSRSMPYRRFIARSICPSRVVPVMTAPIVPSVSASERPCAPASCAWSTASVRTAPAGPGKMS